MSLRNVLGGNRAYIVVAFFIIIVIILTVLFSGRDLFPAYVPYAVYDEDGWDEIRSEWTHGSELFGLESWNSYNYRNNDSRYPAYLTVTTMKTFFMMNEKELKEKTKETIITEASNQNISIDRKTEISGERRLKNGHSTMYIEYNATLFLSENITERVKFIGETWNCDKSSTSVICIGYAQVTNNSKNDSEQNLKYWAKIVADPAGSFSKKYKNTDFFEIFVNPDGLIFNIKCH